MGNGEWVIISPAPRFLLLASSLTPESISAA